ncbi:MAG TPA: MmcQ/YjbR family DNA-binding protein [Lacipirellulaceae bacterium]|jgi:predicted DNA-binding protein (MmcQ/YjbR family)|nr:MmcQ/YjbR family DNA-binding protein [Lacipirellulaceae bacterium]
MTLSNFTMSSTGRTISDMVCEIMANLPEAEEFISHGAATFRVRGKVFATYTINHHGDGRVALNLIAPPGAQEAFVKMRSDLYFVPAYVGPRGWLGVELDKGLAWSEVYEHVREAYAKVAPAELVRSVDPKIRVRPPTRKFRPEEVDRFASKIARTVLKKLETICSRLPETERSAKFGCPMWKAGAKTFVCAHFYTGRLKLQVWVGAARQKQLVRDKRFQVSQYTGHNGWIDLDVEKEREWDEIEQLVLESYRHFALKRMLRELDERRKQKK